MNINIYDTANTLERELRQMPAYLAVKSALEKIHQDPKTTELFLEFREMTDKLQTAQEQASPEEVQAVETLYNKVMANDAIKQLMENEQQLGLLMNDLNQIINRPLHELYHHPSE